MCVHLVVAIKIKYPVGETTNHVVLRTMKYGLPMTAPTKLPPNRVEYRVACI